MSFLRYILFKLFRFILSWLIFRRGSFWLYTQMIIHSIRPLKKRTRISEAILIAAVKPLSLIWPFFFRARDFTKVSTLALGTRLSIIAPLKESTTGFRILRMPWWSSAGPKWTAFVLAFFADFHDTGVFVVLAVWNTFGAGSWAGLDVLFVLVFNPVFLFLLIFSLRCRHGQVRR